MPNREVYDLQGREVIESLIPKEAQKVILSLLGKWTEKQHIVGVRTGPYHLKPTIKQEVDIALGSYVQWLMERDADQLNQKEFLLHLEELAYIAIDKDKHTTICNLTSQLSDLSEMIDLVNTQQIDKAIRMFATADDGFAKSHRIHLDNPRSVMSSNSFVQHPWAQAMTIDLMTRLYPNLNNLELQQIKLALCWHLLPNDQPYKIRALTECLDSFASFISTEEDGQARATPVWETTTQLAESINDSFTSHTHTT